MSEETFDEYTGELLPATPVQTARTVDLRDRATDSWTDVLSDVITLSRGIANTEFVPKGIRGSVEKTTAAVLYGRELGLPPMTGLGQTHVIEGRAGISAELMRALILRAGHSYTIPVATREKCTIRGRRKGETEWTEATWTIQEAHQTQVFLSKEKGWGSLSAKAQWRSWPAEMLLARATTRLARMIFPDVISGMRSEEELRDMVVDAEVVEEAAGAPEPGPVRRRRAARPQPKTPAPAAAADVAPSAPENDADPEPTPTPSPTAGNVSRARVSRPAPRPAPAAQGEKEAPEPEAVATADAVVKTVPDDSTETVEAEIVEEVPKVPEPAEPESKARKGATTAALMHWNRLGVQDRTERLWLTAELTGKKITSTNDLELSELRALVATLEKCRDMDAVNRRLDSVRAERDS